MLLVATLSDQIALSFLLKGDMSGVRGLNFGLVTTTSVNSILTVRNPTGESTALTITPLAGGTHPVSATLEIQQLG